MPYDQALAQRIQAALRALPGLTEKKMFGGVGFMVSGNMACGVHGPDLIVRLSPAQYEQAIKQPHVHVFDLTGKPMKGWITVGPAGCATDEDLRMWIEHGVAFAQTLPEK
jgi:TfoX N-terminal domain